MVDLKRAGELRDIHNSQKVEDMSKAREAIEKLGPQYIFDPMTGMQIRSYQVNEDFEQRYGLAYGSLR